MIHVDVSERVGSLVIDRPQRRNALDIGLCIDLRDGLDTVVAAGARCVVITGAGTAFCAGADLGGVYAGDFRTALYGLLGRMCDVAVPIVAAVNGPAIGAGTQLAIAADLRVAGPTARFGVPTAKLGLAVDQWTIRRLALLAGGGPARSMLLACREIGAEQAFGLGLVDQLGTAEDAFDLARTISGLAPLTLAYNKLALERSFESAAADDDVAARFEACWASKDFVEGQNAFRDKRAATFEGA